jgi:fibronectin type 3 domain-containing protein
VRRFLSVLAALGLTLVLTPVAAASSVSVEGIVQAVHVDPVDPAGATATALMLRTATGLLALDPGRTSLFAGDYVRLRGVRHGGRLSVRAARRMAPRTAAGRGLAARAAAPVAASPQLAVVLINFADDTRTPFTADAVTQTVFSGAGSVASYYAEQSFGKVNLTGTVVGPYTLAATSSTCDYATWATQARAAAGAAINAYTNVMYLFPTESSCAWAGLGDLPGPETWINGYLQLRVLAHELGHNLGVHHANALSCSAGGVRSALAGICTSTEYGDPFSVMGSGSTRQFPAYHKAELGWITPAGVYTITATGTYRVSPDELATGSPQLLRIVRATDALYIDYRQPFGTAFDNFAVGAPGTGGVLVRRAPKVFDQTQPALVDATPLTTSFADAALLPGTSLADPATGVTITTTAVSATAATVHVVFPGTAVAPSAPGAVTATTGGGAVDVTWSAATDDGAIAHYRVFRNGITIAAPVGLAYHDPSPPSGSSLTYAVAAVDDQGLEGQTAAAAALSVGDVEAPSAPGTPAASLGLTTVTLSWPAATDNVGVATYVVSRDGVAIASPVAPTVKDAAAAPGQVHAYVVRARDAAGNVSAPSDVVEVFVPDVVPPSPPGHLEVAVAATPWGATLTWSASQDDVGVSGYRIYRNGALVDTVTGLAFTDAGLGRAGPTGYAVGAVDAAGLESLRTRVTATPPPPDSVAPAAPASLHAVSRSRRRIALAWTPAVDDVGIARYEVVVAGRIVNRTTRTTVVVALHARRGALVKIAVQAVDAAGNRSRRVGVRVRVR